jgi:hypothetical protein
VTNTRSTDASSHHSNGRGDIRPDLVVVPPGADRSIDLHLFAVADVTGWFEG